MAETTGWVFTFRPSLHQFVISANGTKWIGGGFEIGRSVCLCTRIHNRQERWRPPVKTSTLAEICTLTSAF